MPVPLSYPGVYIEEVSSGVRTITGVATSIALFIGWAPRGPTDRAVRLTSFADFERTYGGLDFRSVLGYSVKHFYENGGADAYVLRIADATAVTASCAIDDLSVSASSPGDWAADYQVRLTRRADDATRFRLDVLHVPSNGAVVESFENLSMTTSDARFVEAVVNGRSGFIAVSAGSATTPGTATVDLDATVAGAAGTVIGPADAAFRTALLASFGAGSHRRPHRSVQHRLRARPDPRHDDFHLAGALPRPPRLPDRRFRGGGNRGLRGRHPGQHHRHRFGQFGLLLPLGASARSAPARCRARLSALRLRRRHLCPHRQRARRLEGARPASRPALTGTVGLGDHHDRPGERPAQPARRSTACAPSRPTATWSGARAPWPATTTAAREWKYVPVRRTALFIEESLYRGTQWVVFEPNDEPLWAQIRLNVGAFMQNLFRQGAFQGTHARARPTSSSATARPRPRTTSTSASSTSWSASRRSSRPSSWSSRSSRWPAKSKPRRNEPWHSSPSMRSASIRTRTSNSASSGTAATSPASARSARSSARPKWSSTAKAAIPPRRASRPAAPSSRRSRSSAASPTTPSSSSGPTRSGTSAPASARRSRCKDFRKDIIIEVYNEAGQLALAYKIFRCWVSEFQALPDLDANANAVAIQHIKLENEGWERDYAVTEPAEPRFTEPA